MCLWWFHFLFECSVPKLDFETELVFFLFWWNEKFSTLKFSPFGTFDHNWPSLFKIDLKKRFSVRRRPKKSIFDAVTIFPWVLLMFRENSKIFENIFTFLQTKIFEKKIVSNEKKTLFELLQTSLCLSKLSKSVKWTNNLCWKPRRSMESFALAGEKARSSSRPRKRLRPLLSWTACAFQVLSVRPISDRKSYALHEQMFYLRIKSDQAETQITPPLMLKITRIQGGVIWLSGPFLGFWWFLVVFTLLQRPEIATFFGRLRRDFRLYKVPESKIFARLRRDFRLYTVPKSKIFARAYGALDIHSIKWPFCAAGKKILGVLRSKQHDFPLELESNRPK